MFPRGLLFALMGLACIAGPGYGQWNVQVSGTHADFRGLSVVDRHIAWASGTRGTYIRTVDGGKTWQAGVVPGAEKLDFRDVDAFGADLAYLMSAGPGENSRIYKTVDGGENWILQFTNPEPKGFFDAIAFWDANNGLAFSDPVRGKYYLIATGDGGNTWKPLPGEGMPNALEGEGAFAASGTSLLARGDSEAWLCTGGAAKARIFHTINRGKNWKVLDTPLVAGTESAGIFSMGWRDGERGLLVGGDYKKPGEIRATAALTRDGGTTWQLAKGPLPYSSGVAWAKDRWIAVGPGGSHVSLDDGITWKRLDTTPFNAVQFARDGVGWAVGPKGTVARLEPSQRK